MKMIDKVAEDLFAVTSRMKGSLLVPFKSQPQEIKDYHYALARRAVESIRAPAPEMIIVGYTQDATDLYQRMVDAALSQKPDFQ